MTEIKPIETIYKGYKFRSRLEARWAVFFDACNVKWEYEPEGYDLGDGVCYLPDFLLHDIGIRSSEDKGKLYDLYVEVKGVMTEEDVDKINRFSSIDYIWYTDDNGNECGEADIKNMVLVVGNIPENIDDMVDCFYESRYTPSYYSFKNIDDDEFPALLVIKDGKLLIRGADSNYLSDVDEEGTEKAFALARQARFEHGEKPKI